MGMISFFTRFGSLVQNTIVSTGRVVNKTVGDVFSSYTGDVDPARLFGYGLTVWGAIQFYVSEAYITIKTGTFDTANFAIGMVSISGALMAAAAGVWIKNSTENRPPREPDRPMDMLVKKPDLTGFRPVDPAKDGS